MSAYEQEQIETLVNAGVYLSTSDFIREAVRDKLERLRVVMVQDVDHETAKQMVLGYFKRNGKAYPSDAAADLELDLEQVFAIVEELSREGRLGE